MDNNKKVLTQNIKDINANITQKVKANIPLQFQYVLGVYFLSLFFMMLYRIASFFIHCFLSLNLSDFNLWFLLRSVVVGIRFDSIALCYLLSLWLVVMFLGTLFSFNRKYIYRPLHIILCFVCFCLFLVSALDTAYFSYFNSHINIVALSWLQTPKYLTEVIARNPQYILYGVVFLLTIAWFLWLMYSLYNATLFRTIPPYSSKQPIAKTIILGIILGVVCFIGARGRIIEKKPLSISDAYYCDNDFFNQLGVSPVFNLAKSFDERKHLREQSFPVVDAIQAKQIIDQEFMNRDDANNITPSLPENTNIVFILMEDVSLDNITRKEMPNLYNIYRTSLAFTNVYSNGISAYDGLYSTLYSYPNVFSSNPMEETIMPKMDGLPNELQDRGYKTLYFTTIAQKQNNVSRFLSYNGIENIYSGVKINTKKEIQVLDKIKTPFFACIMMNKQSAKEKKNVMDKHIYQFISNSKNHSWYKNTLFVFVGANSWGEKIPVFMYNTKSIKSDKNNTLASQMDIAPTVLAMIDKTYQNKTLGLNIFSERRTFAFSSADDSLMVYGDYYNYEWNKNNEEHLWKLIDGEEEEQNTVEEERLYFDATKQEPSQSKKMREYAFSMFQTAQYNILQAKMRK